MLAQSLSSPINRIAADKIADLLEIKKKLGLPDCRFAEEESPPAEALFMPPDFCSSETVRGNRKSRVSQEEIEDLVAKMTNEVMKLLAQEE